VSQFTSSAVGSSRWVQKRRVVPASSSLVIDTRPLSSYLGQSYYLNIYNSDEGVFKTLHVVTSRSGSNICYTVYSKLGDLIDFTHSVSVSGSDVVVTVQNNETFDLNVVINKLDFLS